MEYDFRNIEKKWQEKWVKDRAYLTGSDPSRPKYYLLDMFPYPSGAGLHVGHPLGYIASDIIARYTRHRGFNVLHPMGYDAFGLPAEQYAIQTGQHPAITTEQNICRFREQLDKIGLSYDWEREVRTCDPEYYKWTQWIFLKLFDAWYNKTSDRTEHISTLVAAFEKNGNQNVNACCDEDTPSFTASEWKSYEERRQREILMKYRIAYLSEAYVWWCPGLGSVLANDEVKDGVSERGGFPVEKKLMKQWSMRITAYADRLLKGLDTIEWSESIKESQRNWIGKSEGAMVVFDLIPAVKAGGEVIEVFTTRPDTLFGVTFITLAPEHELVAKVTTPAQKEKVEAYVRYASGRSERDRMSEVKKITGEFTGAYADHPFTGEKIPVWVGEYVLAGYGTGAVMGVPAHDSRDHAFAKHFGLEIKPVVAPGKNTNTENSSLPSGEGRGGVDDSSGWDFNTKSWDEKSGKCMNSSFLDGLDAADAIRRCIEELEKNGKGKGKVNYRMRDAVFGRQRYWGEPIPIYYKDGIPYPLSEEELPLKLPEIEKYLPTETGEPPLARAKGWKYQGKYDYELTTMPGWAGSSWYYLRYMDPKNAKEFVSQKAAEYWKEIDFYIGGAEHATGHLLYVRFWTKALKDLGYIPIEEPAKKLVNQGMIQGVSALIYRMKPPSSFNKPLHLKIPQIFVTKNKAENYNRQTTMEEVMRLIFEYNKLPYDASYVANYHDNPFIKSHIELGYVMDENLLRLDIFSKSNFGSDSVFLCEKDDTFQIVREVEKMSKSKLNVVNPDDMCEQYGADTFRMYEMFLGPLEQSKPWNTNGISGVSGFLKKTWRLFGDYMNPAKPQPASDNTECTAAELKALNKTIQKITDDIERMSLNTCVSSFMICVNELTELKCNKRAILEPLVILLSPFAPHLAEELWEKLGHKDSVLNQAWPMADAAYLSDDSFAYPIQFNGKTRFNLELSLSLSKEEIEKEVLAAEQTKKYLAGNTVKKVIVVPKRIVNVVM